MLEIPRGVPSYAREQVGRSWWYCLQCCHSAPLEATMRAHVRRVHETPEESDLFVGSDYTSGDHLLILMSRWEAWSLESANRFARELESLRGADDFEFEVGEGIPEGEGRA